MTTTRTAKYISDDKMTASDFPFRPPTAKEYIAAAHELHEVEGEIEIDDFGEDETKAHAEKRISRSEDGSGECGAYVRAWVWVNREEIQPEYAAAAIARAEGRS